MENFNYKKLIPIRDFKDITSNSILKGEWFVGSALTGVDYARLETGCYFYYQDTIWSKIIDMEQVNPYWEIFNQTFNVLLVNCSKKTLLDFIMYFITNLKIELNINNNELIVATSNEYFRNLLNKLNINSVYIKLPFYINKKEVGVYSKLFVYKNNSIYPLIDFTNFVEDDRDYVEVSINKNYINIYRKLVLGVIELPKIKILDKYFPNLKGFSSFYNSQEIIRFGSLMECAMYLSKQKHYPNSKYNGHVTKKILKEVFFYGEVLKSPLLDSDVDFCNEYIDFFISEKKKYLSSYKKLTKQRYTEDLLSTHGLSHKLYLFLLGEYRHHFYQVDKSNLNYFTDLPFVEEGIEINQLGDILEYIKRRKAI